MIVNALANVLNVFQTIILVPNQRKSNRQKERKIALENFNCINSKCLKRDEDSIRHDCTDFCVFAIFPLVPGVPPLCSGAETPISNICRASVSYTEEQYQLACYLLRTVQKLALQK